MKRLFDEVVSRTELADLDVAARRLALRTIVSQADAVDDVPAALSEIADSIDGYGPLSEAMRDPAVTDILVNGHADVWVERAGRMQPSAEQWRGKAELQLWIERIVGGAGAMVDVSHPIADARLPDGSRIHVVLPPVAPAGPLVSIRRWPRMPLRLHDLVANEMLTEEQAGRLRSAVADRASIAVSGPTGSGKTTVLNALLGCVAADERVVTIEETAELRPPCAHAVSLVARRPNVEGKGEVSLFDLVRTSLRMRPDRIVVGEVRGREMLAALTAMSTGHDGSMLTVHAKSARDAVERMLTLALSGETGAAETTLRRRIESAFDLIIHLDRVGDKRMVAAIEEVRPAPR